VFPLDLADLMDLGKFAKTIVSEIVQRGYVYENAGRKAD
jgi:hypothetical protein